jgi:putative acetyltransferase
MRSQQAVVIRCARADDATQIAQVLRASFREYRTLYTKQGYAATTPVKAEILRRFNEGPIWIAEDNATAVGTVSGMHKADSFYVRSMAVLPQARGQGIGHALLEKVEAFCREHRYRRLFLSTTPFLTDAIHLYETHGFRRTEEGPLDIFGTPLFTMDKRLLPHR